MFMTIKRNLIYKSRFTVNYLLKILEYELKQYEQDQRLSFHKELDVDEERIYR